ncbi:transcriptional protein SWT1 [Eublepharis macularius]|uniref:Transcriptional protein SWT1 n=1 Tax=Eublepharis macularius TaxID=481883 RepID=A0AA97JFY8_EUBMA|nr:transcriptional protein SWT1 [Eublepharis macularius]XP_054837046.1 transcriptional protein SWT1 [Eublepharis macularius]XP_054837047.1 transcriptional protein SWT1 [Eublepharis macularius]
MSQRHSRKSNKKYGASDSKHSTSSSDRKLDHSTSSSPERVKKKYEGAEISKYNSKEQPLSQRFEDGAGYSKTKTHLDVKGTTKDFKEEASEGISSNAEKREKITIHFKNKAKLGGGINHRDTAVAFLGNEDSESNACSESGAKRRRKGLEDLKVINSWEKNKKKATVEHTKVQEIIVKRVLEQFEETILPTLCSSQLRKKPSSPSFCRQQKTSKKLPKKLFVQGCREAFLKRAKQTSPELPSKSSKEIKHLPLPELPKCWKYHKQMEQQRPDPIYNICNSRTHRKRWEEAALHMNQNSCGLLEVSCLAEPTESTNADQEMQIIEDLHAVRVDKKIVLPVVETCGELTSMEIDGDEEANKSFRTLSDVNTLIVIDTNIMISHLEFIRSLKNTDIPGIGKFGLIIPWVVLQELDNLKKGRILANVAQKAIPAVHFIHRCLKNQDSKLWGQSVQLASQQIDGFNVENNDDRVLQCCLQYQELFPQAEVVLLTDDKNLCNKALVSEVKAVCKAELVTALWKLDLNNAASTTWLQSEKESKNLQKSTDPLSGVIFDLEKSLGEVLSSILQTEMKIAYGDLWTEVVYRTPPWTLSDLLECYKKHWIAVFGQIIPRSFLSTIECLSTRFCKAGKASHTTTEVVLQETKMLLETFSSRSDYDGALPQALTSVNKLCETLKKIQSGTGQNSLEVACEKMEDATLIQHTEAEAKSLPTEPSAHENRHPEIWSVLETVWNTMNLYRHEVFQKLDLSAIDTIQYRSSFKEAFLGLQKLMAAVNEILAGIQQVLMPNSSFQDVWTLYNFLTKNKINSSITFTAEEFYDCVSQGMYRERLSIGCSQLVQLEHAIKQCYESVSLEAKTRGWL